MIRNRSELEAAASGNLTPGSKQFVRVRWLDAVPASQAFNELGLFGNQNTVCQPTTPSGVTRSSA
ncbi:MAG: hypothetical protein LH480_08140 [Rubrivivax sp.]|nr:hypothetical protein [Rubrivivax sp.]